jgi:hypothetical protein
VSVAARLIIVRTSEPEVFRDTTSLIDPHACGELPVGRGKRNAGNQPDEALSMRIEGEVWLDGIYRGVFELYTFRASSRNFSCALVRIEEQAFVARRMEPGTVRFDVAFALDALDTAIAHLRKDLDAEEVGPITIPFESTLREADPPRRPRPSDHPKPRRR